MIKARIVYTLIMLSILAACTDEIESGEDRLKQIKSGERVGKGVC